MGMDMGASAADGPHVGTGRGAETTAACGSGAGMGIVMGMGVSTGSVESWWVAGRAVRAGVVTMASVGGAEPLVRH